MFRMVASHLYANIMRPIKFKNKYSSHDTFHVIDFIFTLTKCFMFKDFLVYASF